MTTQVPLETFGRVCPLGVRFWDPVDRKYVSDGLVVNVRLASSQTRTLAVANGSIFAAMNLPFLAVTERGTGDDAYWQKVLAKPLAFVVEVDDPLGRYLCFSFPAQLPNRGLFMWGCPYLSPQGFGLADGVTLFPAPSYPVASTRAVIRADLQDVDTKQGAAGAVLQAVVDGALTVQGIADANGRVAIVFPWPEPRDFPPVDGSPLPATGNGYTSHTWPVVLSVRYGAITPFPAYPDLCTSFGQVPAQLWNDPSGTPVGTQTLTMGQELVVRSLVGPSGVASSVLLVKG
jgi:hypothetical protein